MITKSLAILGLAAALVLPLAGTALADRLPCLDDKPCYGTNGPDELTGNLRNNFMVGLDGNDRLVGGEGNDTLFADAQDPTGQEGNDLLFGGPDRDTLVSIGGADQLVGNEGHDRIFAEDSPFARGGADEVFGGAGNDEINVWDRQPDTVDCGGGSDTVVYDVRYDTVKNCETKHGRLS
jgi:Ca2+-binding RTX toxin-like protein